MEERAESWVPVHELLHVFSDGTPRILWGTEQGHGYRSITLLEWPVGLGPRAMKGTSEPVGTVKPIPDINNIAAVFQTTAPALVPPSATPQPPP